MSELKGIAISCTEKITETRNLADLLGMFTQLGAIEKPKVAA